MATEVHSVPAPPTLLERRSGSRLQLLSDHPTPHLTDSHTQNEVEATRSARGSFASSLTFTPLTPILASPVPTPAITTATPSTSGANLNPAAIPTNFAQNSGGIKHKRSRSTLSRLHVALPVDYFDAQNHARSATVPAIPVPSLGSGQLPGSPPSPRFLKDIFIMDGIPIARTPSPSDDREVDFATVSPQVSVAPKLPRPRTKPVRKSFTLGSDDEDDLPERQQKCEATAKAKKLERYDDLRRYHALMELLKTEAKYLQDLQILINVCTSCCQPDVYTNSSTQVYLQQLHNAVTSRSVASYFGTSASPLKQTPSPSPSTFNSTHTQGQPTNPPPSPVHPTPTVRRKSVGASDRVETEKDLPFTRPVFTEEDMQLLCRNSDEIFTFHECFVGDLKEALAPLGSKFRFDTEDEYAYLDMPRHDTLELAIQITVSMFIDRVSPHSRPSPPSVIIVTPFDSLHEIT